MNCLDFHREKLADPRRLSAEAQAHMESCPACAAFARSVDDSERSLERSLSTPVPEGLADRVLLRTRLGNPARRKWAIAAGVVLGSALGWKYFRDWARPSDQYARLAIEHVVMEPESLTTLRNADAEALRTVLHEFGGTLKEPLGSIRYIRLCPFEGAACWHIVFETTDGLATLILVPGKSLPAPESASTGGWNALAQPVARGYYAIVTPSAAVTAKIDRMLREKVDWSA
jgi:hypothetical protein